MNRSRETASAIFAAALSAADPCEAIRRAVQWNVGNVGSQLRVQGKMLDFRDIKHAVVVGAGKASVPMAAALIDIFGSSTGADAAVPRISGVVVTKYGHTAPAFRDRIPPSVTLLEAAHPVPDAAGLAAAQAILHAVRAADPATSVVFLVLSGGASALTPCPVPGISLEDLQAASAVLLASGAAIDEVNAVRKHCSAFSGGRLATACGQTPLITLVLSDVVGDRLDVIGSGPSAPDESTFATCAAIISKYCLQEMLPHSVIAHLARGARADASSPDETLKVGRPHDICAIVGSGALALEAAAAQATALGYHTCVLSSTLQGEAGEVAKVFAGVAHDICRGVASFKRPACILAGGELTVTLPPLCTGMGGRNQEFALAAMVAFTGLHGFPSAAETGSDKSSPSVCFAALGTDGTDGPNDAAGALTDADTLQLAATKGRSPAEYLRRHDSYNFFAEEGAPAVASDAMDASCSIHPHPACRILPAGHVMTGPTGTNVMDIYLTIVE